MQLLELVISGYKIVLEVVRRVGEGQKWHEVTQNGQKWSEMVRNGWECGLGVVGNVLPWPETVGKEYNVHGVYYDVCL